MNLGFYSKFVIDGIKKNKRLYLPYILTYIGMIMMFYIITFMKYDKTIADMEGGTTLGFILKFGVYVIAVFASIFLFYTNSFLIKRRKKEFGLYNVLGMSRGKISKIIFFETTIITVFSLGIGLILGIAFSKISELGLLRILKADYDFSFSVSIESIVITVILFAIISLLIFLNSIRQIKFSTAINLLASDNSGEKPPKANWVLGIGGLLILAVAYYIAISIQEPVAAMLYFFIAVVLVIIGTYLVMISGSVLLCKILKKNKNYYYKTNHFISVSSMAYRMKRNGAGLATICILATMVLVMISSTSCLYMGAEESLENSFPRELCFKAYPDSVSDLSDEKFSRGIELINEDVKKHGVTMQNAYGYRSVSIMGVIDGNEVTWQSGLTSNISNVGLFTFVPVSDYNKIMGENLKVKDGEAYIYGTDMDFKDNIINFTQGRSLKVAGRVDEFVSLYDSNTAIESKFMLIVNDLPSALGDLNSKQNEKDYVISPQWVYNFDVPKDQIAILNAFYDDFSLLVWENLNVDSTYAATTENSRNDFYTTYGGLFYLGILLSLVFIVAAVLIIYYKQISEGYEDQSRFDIMQKVGMNKSEIKKSINSQLLTVFFLPLIMAGLHIAFAFPMITKMLRLFYLYNVKLFLLVTVISFVVFALCYGLVYKGTSKAYYNIVSEGE